MIVKFLEKAVAYGLGYQENEMAEFDDKKAITTQVLTTLLDEKGVAKGYAYRDHDYKIQDLIDKGVCRQAREEDLKEYTKAKAAYEEKVKNKTAKADEFFFICAD